MVCVGVPIGSPAFVHGFVADKTRKMVQDVKELQILTDPDIHFKLVKFCHNTRPTSIGICLPPPWPTQHAVCRQLTLQS